MGHAFRRTSALSTARGCAVAVGSAILDESAKDIFALPVPTKKLASSARLSAVSLGHTRVVEPKRHNIQDQRPRTRQKSAAAKENPLGLATKTSEAHMERAPSCPDQLERPALRLFYHA